MKKKIEGYKDNVKGSYDEIINFVFHNNIRNPVKITNISVIEVDYTGTTNTKEIKVTDKTFEELQEEQIEPVEEIIEEQQQQEMEVPIAVYNDTKTKELVSKLKNNTSVKEKMDIVNKIKNVLKK